MSEEKTQLENNKEIKFIVIGILITLLALVFYSFIETNTLSGAIIDNDTWNILKELNEQGAIVEVCSTPLDGLNRKTCDFKLHPMSGFWINDIYNTCTYIAPDGNVIFDGYCYKECKQKPCSYEENKEVQG